jgi:prophage regulatory protein
MVQAIQAILRRPQVERLTGLRRSSLYALVQAGKFPRPIKLSEKAVGWLELEIVEWQQRRVAERDARIAAPRRRRRRGKVEGWAR